jgi:D-arabinose 1-dehydrogenase-like Zn-dependent alcohol dehydrogenase
VRAVVYEAFGSMPTVETLSDPRPAAHGAVVRIEASGLCRSDWHGWMGHDPDIRRFPHVPGHELAGVVEEVGPDVRRSRPGDRVTVPFVCACGSCPQCAAGNHLSIRDCLPGRPSGRCNLPTPVRNAVLRAFGRRIFRSNYRPFLEEA